MLQVFREGRTRVLQLTEKDVDLLAPPVRAPEKESAKRAILRPYIHGTVFMTGVSMSLISDDNRAAPKEILFVSLAGVTLHGRFHSSPRPGHEGRGCLLLERTLSTSIHSVQVDTALPNTASPIVFLSSVRRMRVGQTHVNSIDVHSVAKWWDCMCNDPFVDNYRPALSFTICDRDEVGYLPPPFVKGQGCLV